MNFTTEIREIFGNKYLKVFLKDTTLNSEIKILLSELNSIRRVNITKNSREDLTVYPAKTIEIEVLNKEIRNTLSSYFKESIQSEQIEKGQEPVAENQEEEITKTEDNLWSKFLVIWNNYHNHFYGIVTILSFGIAIYTLWPSNNGTESNPDSKSKDGAREIIIDQSNWVTEDTFTISEYKNYPILDKNIFIGKKEGNLIIGGINSDSLKIGFKSQDGEELEVFLKENGKTLVTQYIGDKIIELEYIGSKYRLIQNLTDYYAAPGDIDNWYFNHEFYLNKISSSTMNIKNFKDYKRKKD